MRRAFAPMIVVATAAAVVAAAEASGGTQATGAKLNGKSVDASGPLTLRPGDRIETGPESVTLRSVASASVTVLPQSAVEHMGTDRGVESFFVIKGTVEGDVGASAIVGSAAGWATAPDDAAARVRVAVAPTGALGAASGGTRKDAATFRAVTGSVWIRFHAVATWLPPGCEATLVPSDGGPGSMTCSARAGNDRPIDVTRATGDLTHAAGVPAGATVTLADRAGGTRFECRGAPAGSLVRIEVRRGARTGRSAAIGAGSAALLSGADVTLEIPALPAGLLPSLIGLEREFATLGTE